MMSKKIWKYPPKSMKVDRLVEIGLFYTCDGKYWRNTCFKPGVKEWWLLWSLDTKTSSWNKQTDIWICKVNVNVNREIFNVAKIA